MRRLAIVLGTIWCVLGGALLAAGLAAHEGVPGAAGLPRFVFDGAPGLTVALPFRSVGLTVFRHSVPLSGPLAALPALAWFASVFAVAGSLMPRGRGPDFAGLPPGQVTTRASSPAPSSPDRVIAVRTRLTGKNRVLTTPDAAALLSPAASLEKAVGMVDQGVLDDAVPLLQDLVRSGGGEREVAQSYLAVAFLKGGDLQVAKGYLEHVSPDKLDHAACYALALACLENGLDMRAEQLLRHIYAQDVRYRDVKERLAKLEEHTAAEGSVSSMRKLLPPRFKHPELVGRGGMGLVFRAHDEDLQRAVAIKILSPDVAGDLIQQRFLTEARALARLRHKCLVEIFDIKMDRVPWFVMEFVDGVTLGRLGERGLAPARALRYLVQVLDGLAYCHKKGVYHRDVKPENILVTADDEVKIVDFGLVRLADSDSLTKPGMFIGTPLYASPEQSSGGPVDQRSDIFSLGATFEYLFTGRHRRRPEATTPARPIPPGLAAVFDRCLAALPEDRFQSCEEIVAALEAADLRGLPTTSPVPVPLPDEHTAA